MTKKSTPNFQYNSFNRQLLCIVRLHDTHWLRSCKSL